ncbi:N-acetylmuramoyl-L-alanine amidase [Aliterella atlantica]|uniref:N-acetylmuramoyl-L-alanine amidase n=1 Tax=Aliterella atlantica CENA595 TaxID=1618023 RepID=A0A0D8ZQB9_9CYAN|nr:N-acetylmuramoyl-L-alanine amidase [Aliterella atlantica]KJH71013.1 N-acetylmuramoyl-L-alanine amidase [Aliterella atlantica CENA595]
MRKLLGLVATGTVIVSSSARAEQPLSVVYPPAEHQTTANQIFLIGTAPPQGNVLVNGKAIVRSQAGHFAPSFPLKVGENLFTLYYQNQQVQIKVKRLPTTEAPPVGLAFGKDSLIPAVDIARVPGEVICFGATAPAKATVNVRLGDRTIPLLPQSQNVQLPPNSAALTGQDKPATESIAGKYQGCATALQPADLGQPEFQLTLNGQTTKQLGTGKVTILSPLQLEIAEVTADSGVARTGASTDNSRLTPLPKGTQAAITGREGEWLRLDYGGWINSNETRVFKGVVPPTSIIRSIRARQVPGATEVVFPLQVPVPVSVQQGNSTLTLTLYNTTAQTDIIRLDDDPLISRLDWQQVVPNRVQYTFNLKSAQQWGYKLRYDGTSLVLSLRHPPKGDRGRSKPLSGMKILLDPGHGGKELGSKGPTGYPEKDINLLVSKLVRAQLVAKGAIVYMTREEDKDVSLSDRVAIIDKLEPAIAVSIHYNALPDGGDAMKTKGIAAFWYNSQAHSLALFMHNYLVKELNRPSYGVYWNNLALTRPTTAPSVLLELGFMINPTEFEWITNQKEQQKLANAIADGINLWFSQSQQTQ